MTKKRILIFALFIMLFRISYSQSGLYVKTMLKPGLSWSNDELSKTYFLASRVNSIGWQFSERIGLEIGFQANDVGYRLEKTVDVIGVIDGGNTYLLRGDIPVKLKYKDRFHSLLLQMNYSVFQQGGTKVCVNVNGLVNRYKRTNHKFWYNYKTSEEFMTDNTVIESGKEKYGYSYEIGLSVEQRLFEKFYLIGGLQYSQLFHETKFPNTPKERQYYRLAAVVGIKYYLQSKKDSD